MCISSENGFLKRLAASQAKDERMNAIIQLLENGPYKDYIMQHNILCKIIDKLLFVVPNQMKSSIIRDVHEKGHFHTKKMKEIIEKEFYIDNLSRRIEKHITSCVKCILGERKRGKVESFLYPIPKGETPLDTFHIDHVGPMHNTKKNYKYMLAIIDSFTKYCWLFPTKTLNTEETIQKLEIIADTFGYPKRIIADRGGAFTSTQFRSFCETHDIRLHLITTGVPRGNGQVERLHSTVITALTKLSLVDHEKWYVHVKPLQRILNATFQRAIGTTPFELLVGIEMRTEQETRIMEAIEEEARKSFEADRDEQRKNARQEIHKIQEENKRNYNKKRKKAVKYSTGDLVAIKRTQLGTGLKVRAKFFGPYKVVAVKGFDRYKVEKEGEHEGPKSTEVSADNIKRWTAAEDEDEVYEEDSGSDAESISSESEQQSGMAGCGAVNIPADCTTGNSFEA